jgi:hypothetical protein
LKRSFESPLSFRKIQQDFGRPLQDLVSFATDRPSAPRSVLLWEAKEHDAATPVAAYYRPIFWSAPGSTRPSLSPSDMLFRFADLPNDFDQFITRWFELHQRLAPFWGSFLGLAYSPARFVEARFELTMRAVLLLARAHVDIPEVAAEIEALRWLLHEVEPLLPIVLGIDRDDYLQAIEVLRNQVVHGLAVDAVRTHWITEELGWLVKTQILYQLTGPASEGLLRRNRALEYARQQLRESLNEAEQRP